MANEQEFSFQRYFLPLTTLKALHIILLVGLIAFANSVFNSFVWDDKIFITQNPDMFRFDIVKLFAVNKFNQGSYYRPIPAVYFAALYSFFKETPFFYHVLQILLHVTNAALVFVLFKRFFMKSISLLLVLVFLVHPIQVESVVYIAQSVSPLFFLFGIIALLLSMDDRIGAKKTIVIFVLSLLSCLTKETGFLFIGLIVLYRILCKRQHIRRFLLCGSLVTLLYFLLRFGVGKVFFMKPVLVPMASLPFGIRLINVPAIIWYYARTLLFPNTLAVDQLWTRTTLSPGTFFFPLLIDSIFLFVILATGFYLYKTNHKNCTLFLFFTAWLVFGLGMLLQLFPLDMTIADRWFYFPLVGVLGLLGLVLNGIPMQKRSLKVTLTAGMVTILLLLSIRTIERNTDWKDPVTLYSHDSHIEDNFDVENNLGSELSLVGRYHDAEMHLKKSIQLFPYEMNYANLGATYQRLGDLSNAQKSAETALQMKGYKVEPHRHEEETYVNLASIYMQQNAFAEEVKELHQGLTDYPNSPRMWLYLAYSEYQLHHQEKALYAASQAYRYSPNTITAGLYQNIMSQQPLKIHFTFSP